MTTVQVAVASGLSFGTLLLGGLGSVTGTGVAVLAGGAVALCAVMAVLAVARPLREAVAAT